VTVTTVKTNPRKIKEQAKVVKAKATISKAQTKKRARKEVSEESEDEEEDESNEKMKEWLE
jgi:hypothetical protein